MKICPMKKINNADLMPPLSAASFIKKAWIKSTAQKKTIRNILTGIGFD